MNFIIVKDVGLSLLNTKSFLVLLLRLTKEFFQLISLCYKIKVNQSIYKEVFQMV